MRKGFIARLQTFFRRKGLKKAIKEANRLRASTFKKHLVVFYQGEYLAVSKQRLKELHKAGQFKRGVNLRQIEAMSVYTTN